MPKLFTEVDFADTALRALNGTNRAGKRPHNLADNNNERPFRGRRVPANDNRPDDDLDIAAA